MTFLMSAYKNANLHLVGFIRTHHRSERIATLKTARQRRVETWLYVEIRISTSYIRTIDIRKIACVTRSLRVCRRILRAQSDRFVAVVDRHRAWVGSRDCFRTRERHATGPYISFLDVDRQSSLVSHRRVNRVRRIGNWLTCAVDTATSFVSKCVIGELEQKLAVAVP